MASECYTERFIRGRHWIGWLFHVQPIGPLLLTSSRLTQPPSHLRVCCARGARGRSPLGDYAQQIINDYEQRSILRGFMDKSIWLTTAAIIAEIEERRIAYRTKTGKR
jgi:hypothetical protein